MTTHSHLPPVPPANASPKGPGDARSAEAGQEAGAKGHPNPDKQGQQGNSKINTTHQGYQQDR